MRELIVLGGVKHRLIAMRSLRIIRILRRRSWLFWGGLGMVSLSLVLILFCYYLVITISSLSCSIHPIHHNPSYPRFTEPH